MRALAVALALALAAAGLTWAYTYQGNTDPANGGKPHHGNLPVDWVINDLTSDALSNVAPGSDPKQALRDGFAEWAAESGFSSAEGALSTIDDIANDGVNLMTFADTAVNRDRVGGVDCAFGPLAVTVLRWDGDNEFTDADILFNPCIDWSTNGVADTFSVASVGTHEIGHFLGLDHSVVGGATMYPFGAEFGSFTGSAESPASVSGDDRAGANGLYTDAGFAAKTGAISGTVTRDAALLYGAHVVATRVAGGLVFGSDITRGSNVGETGEYLIEGLPPGSYLVHAEPADGPTTHGNWGPKSMANSFWYDVPFPVDFETTFLGGNSSPTVVAVTAGMTATPAALAVTDGAPTDNPTRIGIIDGGAAAWSGIPLSLAAGSTTEVLVVDTGGGISSDSIVAVACSDPAVTIGSISEPFTLDDPAEAISFDVTIPADAVPGPRSLIFGTDNLETSLLTGFIDVAGPTSETDCDNAKDDDGDGCIDCDDSDCASLPICTDLCPGDPNKTEPGACGCGVPDEDLNGDTVPDCCVAGDVWPDGVGDDAVDLRDWAQAVFKTVSETVPIVAHDLTCGDVGPSQSSCLPTSGPRHACPDRDGTFTVADADVIRGLAAGTDAISCSPCLGDRNSPGGDFRRVADVAPRGDGGDGVADVADVLLILNWAVENQSPPSPGDEEYLRADVAPFQTEEDLRVVQGGGGIDVVDVLAVLRHVVMLDILVWPKHFSTVSATGSPGSFIGFQVVIDGWDDYAETFEWTADSMACATDGGLDTIDNQVVITCLGNPTSGNQAIFGLSYRAPEASSPDTVSLTLIEADLELPAGSAELTPDP